MAGPVVVQGAVLVCPAGTAPSALIVTHQQIETITGLMVATIADCDPETNIPSFGTCNILTSEAGGTPCPCVPVPAGTWVPGSTVRTINGLPVLTSPAELVCSVGATITVSEPGQALEETT